MKSATRKLPKPEAVRDAKVILGAASKCIWQQCGENGDPKRRTASSWGVSTKSTKGEGSK